MRVAPKVALAWAFDLRLRLRRFQRLGRGRAFLERQIVAQHQKALRPGAQDVEQAGQGGDLVTIHLHELQRRRVGGGGPGLTDELMALCKTTLAPDEYPRWVEYVTELPKTATGKIQRYKLRG